MPFVLRFSQQQTAFHLETEAASSHVLTEEETKASFFDIYKEIRDRFQISSNMEPTVKEATVDAAWFCHQLPRIWQKKGRFWGRMAKWHQQR